MPIRRLPEDVTHRIAAGEVIERPASVVKELVENALDAGAERVTVRIVQGGTFSIVVEDDGTGIPQSEVRLAVERFATSKLESIDDLERISTLGFRGEALASIAAVSRFEIRSRKRGTPEGAFIRVEGGRTVAEGSIETSEGTRVQVDDLFFNLPARRKFLKGFPAEQRRILKVIQDFALCSPSKAFLFAGDGKTLFRWEGGNRKEALASILGDPEGKQALYEKGAVRVETWNANGRPGKRTEILSFVNGRRVVEPTVRSALFSLGPEVSGDWIILVECPPGEVDVNIHPAKAEVRFRNPGTIFEAVRGAARAATSRGTDVPLLVAAEPGSPVFPWNGTETRLPYRVAEPRLPFAEKSTALPGERTAAGGQFSAGPGEAKETLYLGCFSEGFLVFSHGDDLVIMDPHAAHERVLFDSLWASLADKPPSQGLVPGEELSPSLSAGSLEHREELAGIGFSFTEKGDGSLILQSVPSCRGLEPVSPGDLLRGALDALDEHSGESLQTRLATRWAYAACHGAVKLGDRFSPEEALALWRRLSEARVPQSCPHGRPTLLRLSGLQLKRHFGRKD